MTWQDASQSFSKKAGYELEKLLLKSRFLIQTLPNTKIVKPKLRYSLHMSIKRLRYKLQTKTTKK